MNLEYRRMGGKGKKIIGIKVIIQVISI